MPSMPEPFLHVRPHMLSGVSHAAVTVVCHVCAAGCGRSDPMSCCPVGLWTLSVAWCGVVVGAVWRWVPCMCARVCGVVGGPFVQGLDGRCSMHVQLLLPGLHGDSDTPVAMRCIMRSCPRGAFWWWRVWCWL